MSIYAEMQKKAKALTSRLNKAYQSKITGLSGFFAPELITLAIYPDSILIERVANCLEIYSESENTKYNVLKAIYIYILKKYSSPLNSSLFNAPLVNLLCEDLNIKQLDQIDKANINTCYAELSQFCKWVYHNQTKDSVGALYQRLPADMQIIINQELNSELPKEQPEYHETCNLLNWFPYLGKMRLF